MSTELTIITPAELQTADGLLAENKVYVEKYRKSVNVLTLEIEKYKDGKLPAELDKRINDTQVSIKSCLNVIVPKRKVYTSKMNEFIKMFTTEENILEKELYPTLQAARDKSAAIYVKEQREKEQEEAKKLAKEQERITLLADAEQQIRNAYADILKEDKQELFDAFNGADAVTIDGVEETLKAVNATFKVDRWNDIIPVISSQVHTEKELDNITMNAKAGKFEACAPHYKTEIDGYASYLLSLIPARRLEISKGEKESKAAAELAEKERAVEAAQQAASDAKVDKEIADALKNAELGSKIEIEKHKLSSPTKPVESYEIQVLSKEGWMHIFQMYFTNSGVEELGNIKMDQMKTWCEKYAKSNGEFIAHSSIRYNEKYKAVARKASKKVEV